MTRRAEDDSLRELSKVSGVLEEGIISFHHRGRVWYDSPKQCHTYILMLPASCRHQVRLLGSESTLPSKQYETMLGSVKETAFMVDDVVTELGPIKVLGRPKEPIAATKLVGKGVYVLYYDGDDVHLLTSLYEQEESDFHRSSREQIGVYKTGDNVIIAGHTLQALWDKNTLQRAGYSSYSGWPVLKPSLLDRKGISFMLSGRHPGWAHPSSKIPGNLAQLLLAAAEESSRPRGFRSGMHDAMAEAVKPHMELAAVSTSPEALEKITSKVWPTYCVRLRISRFSMRKCFYRFLLALFKTFLSEASISYMEEEAYADSSDSVTCLVSCPEEDLEKYCEVLTRKGVISLCEALQPSAADLKTG